MNWRLKVCDLHIFCLNNKKFKTHISNSNIFNLTLRIYDLYKGKGFILVSSLTTWINFIPFWLSTKLRHTNVSVSSACCLLFLPGHLPLINTWFRIILSIYPSVCLSMCLSVCIYVHVCLPRDTCGGQSTTSERVHLLLPYQFLGSNSGPQA